MAGHLEHAYCLTGHGMQGGTVEHATVLAVPRDLTAGWTYTALSRARGSTRLHVDAGEQAARIIAERGEMAPNEAAPKLDVGDVLEQVAARMLVRDDEDLAVDQLLARQAPAGRADDRELERAGALALSARSTPPNAPNRDPSAT